MTGKTKIVSDEKIILQEKEMEYIVDGRVQKKVTIIEESATELYKRRRTNLQMISLAMVVVILVVSPLRLLDSRTIIDITAIGFISASLIPSLIAIFGFVKGQRFSLYLSTFIYGVWILVLSTFFLELLLLIVVLILYFEITRIIQIIHPLIVDVESISEGGAYYHASVTLRRYMRSLLRFGGILFAITLAVGVIGRYTIGFLQSDILFSIFTIIGLILLIILSRRTLTPDMTKILLEERRAKLDLELAKSHSKYS